MESVLSESQVNVVTAHASFSSDLPNTGCHRYMSFLRRVPAQEPRVRCSYYRRSYSSSRSCKSINDPRVPYLTWGQVCWIPIFKGKKLILAGDPMQLPPTILSADKPKKSKQSGGTAKDAPKASNGKKPAKSSAPDRAKQKAEEPADDSDAPLPPDTDISSDSSADEEERSEHDEQKEVAAPLKKPATKKKRQQKPRSLRPPRSLETTMFDRLEKMYGPGIKRMLNVQYRCVFRFLCKQQILTKRQQHACQDRRVSVQSNVS